MTGMIAATFAAPFLTALLMMAFDAAPSRGPMLEHLLDLLQFIPLGAFGLLSFGIPLFLLASIMALALSKLSHPPLWLPMTTGGALGLGFTSVIFMESLDKTWTYLASGTLAGIICGWIYWRIALCGRGNEDALPQHEARL
jgi:hypothetical protein